MSLTAMFWTALYSSAFVATFSNPIFGCLGYLLEYYMRPELKWWGRDLPDLRYNLIISVAFGLSFLMRRSSLAEMKAVNNPALRWLFGLLAIMFLVTPTVAVNTTISWNWMIQWMKMAIIFPLLVVGVIRSRKTFDLFVMAHILGAFWWGWDAWVNPHRDQSRLMSVGSGDTLNDNAASAHLLTVIPFIVVYLLTAKERWKRAIALVALPFVVNTVILCNSRGSTLGLLVALGASLLLVRRGDPLRMVMAGIGVVGALFFLADKQFIARQQTTSNYEEDSSAQQRLISWQAAYRLVKDRPWGTGGRGFHLLSPIYIPDIVAAHRGDLRAPHNTWAMVASEWGVAGFVCYIGIYASAFVMLRRTKRAAHPDEGGFYYWRALAIQLALIGHLVASTFTDRLYGEAGYWMVALSFALYRVQLTEQAERALAPAAVEAAAGGTAGRAAPHVRGLRLMTAHGDTLDVFTPVLARLAADAASYFGVPAVRLAPVDRQERPFSRLLRLRVRDGETERTLSHLFVKVFKPKTIPGGPNALRDRVARDFETTRRVHAAMAPYGDVGTVPPVACYPDLLAIITEQVDGPTLLEFLQKHAAWPHGGKSMGSLCETMERVGRWIRVFQATGPEGGRVGVDDLRNYVDHRLNTLVQHGSGFSNGDRLAVLNHIQALGAQIAPQDLKKVAVHSDLALGNILVSDRRIVVLDFDMSKLRTRLHDLTRLYVQLDLLAVKPRFSSRVVRRLQQALLHGFDPSLSADQPLFRLLCLLHRTNHLTTLTVNHARPAEALYNAFIRRRHRHWIAAELEHTILEPV